VLTAATIKLLQLGVALKHRSGCFFGVVVPYAAIDTRTRFGNSYDLYLVYGLGLARLEDRANPTPNRVLLLSRTLLSYLDSMACMLAGVQSYVRVLSGRSVQKFELDLTLWFVIFKCCPNLVEVHNLAASEALPHLITCTEQQMVLHCLACTVCHCHDWHIKQDQQPQHPNLDLVDTMVKTSPTRLVEGA
jgi:hypothetical protein